MTPRVLCLFLCSLALPLAGCSLFNAPDRSKLEPHDGGMSDTSIDTAVDGGMDGDVDSGMDAGDGGDADAGTPPEDCTAPGDEDGDGLADCDDFDCNGAIACCGTGTNSLTETWAGSLSGTWTREPATVSTGFPVTSGAKLTDFAQGDRITGIITSCQPLALGAQIEFTVQAQPDCMGMDPAPASCAMSVVLTGAEHMAVDHGFLDDFAVRMSASGELSATSAGEVLASAMFTPGQRIVVTVTIGGALDSRGRPALTASVETNNLALSVRATLLEPTIFIRQQSLQGGAGNCASVSGLRLGVEGIGDGVQMDTLTLDTLGCSNPNLFSPPRTTGDTLPPLDLTTPGMDGVPPAMDGGVVGGLAAPTLTHFGQGGSDPWQAYAELTNQDPALERFTRVTWGVGFSQRGPRVDWLTAGPGFPLLGTDPPGCLMPVPDCVPGQPSYREPYVQWLDSDVATETVIFYAFEPGPDMGHEIWVGTQVDADSAVADRRALISPGAAGSGGMGMHLDAGCNDLRDPAAVAIRDDLGAIASNWLFYTCTANGTAPEIHALRLRDSSLSVFPDAMPVTVMAPGMLGPFAAAGVWGAEPVVDTGEDGSPLIRLWFMGRSVGGLATVGLAVASFKSNLASFPTLTPYAANPVLGPTSAALGGCADGCTLSDLAVTRADGATLIFLVARRDGDRYSLVPLSQPWAATTPSVR